MMKKTIKTIASLALLLLLTSAVTGDEIITKEGNTTIVNTTLLTKDVIGYQSPTPVKIFIENKKVVKVTPIRNQETPKYFQLAKALLKKYEGKPVNKVAKMKVDGVTGATMSSDALIKNVQIGVEYYNKNSKK